MTGSNDSWKQVIATFDTDIALYLEQLKVYSDGYQFNATFWTTSENFTVSRQVWIAVSACHLALPLLSMRCVQAAGSISHEITKFSLVHTKNPSVEEAQSICKRLHTPCKQLLSAAKTALFCGIGPSLATNILQTSMYAYKNY